MKAQTAALCKSATETAAKWSRYSQDTHAHGNGNTELLVLLHLQAHDDLPGDKSEAQVHDTRECYNPVLVY